MNWQWLSPSNNEPASIDILHDKKKSPRRLRDRYQHMACAQCGKLDEHAAIRSGIDKISIRARKMDLGYTEDDIFWCSPRLKKLLLSYGTNGLEYIPTHSDHFLLCPTQMLQTDFEKSDLSCIGSPCEECGRYCDVTGWIHTIPPSSESCIYYPEFGHENWAGIITDLLFSTTIINHMKADNVTGIDWLGCEKNSF